MKRLANCNGRLSLSSRKVSNGVSRYCHENSSRVSVYSSIKALYIHSLGILSPRRRHVRLLVHDETTEASFCHHTWSIALLPCLLNAYASFLTLSGYSTETSDFFKLLQDFFYVIKDCYAELFTVYILCLELWIKFFWLNIWNKDGATAHELRPPRKELLDLLPWPWSFCSSEIKKPKRFLHYSGMSIVGSRFGMEFQEFLKLLQFEH